LSRSRWLRVAGSNGNRRSWVRIPARLVCCCEFEGKNYFHHHFLFFFAFETPESRLNAQIWHEELIRRKKCYKWCRDAFSVISRKHTWKHMCGRCGIFKRKTIYSSLLLHSSQCLYPIRYLVQDRLSLIKNDFES
jgi:hypothetical protein